MAIGSSTPCGKGLHHSNANRLPGQTYATTSVLSILCCAAGLGHGPFSTACPHRSFSGGLCSHLSKVGKVLCGSLRVQTTPPPSGPVERAPEPLPTMDFQDFGHTIRWSVPIIVCCDGRRWNAECRNDHTGFNNMVIVGTARTLLYQVFDSRLQRGFG